MLKTNLEKLEPGIVYEAELIKTKDIPEEKVIATQFYIPELDTKPIQVYNYARMNKTILESWYRGKYGAEYYESEKIEGTHWYIWRPPNNPAYLKVIEKIKNYDYFDTSDSEENDIFWD